MILSRLQFCVFRKTATVLLKAESGTTAAAVSAAEVTGFTLLNNTSRRGALLLVVGSRVREKPPAQTGAWHRKSLVRFLPQVEHVAVLLY